MKQLLEVGAHFGHQTRRWNPKMAEYIYSERNGIYIIDLQKTLKKLREAYAVVRELVENGGTILFVGTKKQAQESTKEEAERAGMFYVNTRWLGGTLTNIKTVRKSVHRLIQLEKMEEDGIMELLPKKEVIKLRHQKARLEKNLNGIRKMEKLPDIVFIIDPKRERNAILEARKLGILTIGLVDTNCDPDEVDYPIPANDDAIRSVKLMLSTIGNAVLEARQKEEEEEYEDQDDDERIFSSMLDE